MRVGHFTGPRARERYRRAYDAAMDRLPAPEATADRMLAHADRAQRGGSAASSPASSGV